MQNKLDFSTLNISNIVVHDIPKHKKGDLTIEPTYGQQESELTTTLKLFFKDKVVQSLKSSRSYNVVFDDETESIVPWQIKTLIESKGTGLITNSKLIAKHLFEIQVGNNAAGILVCIFGKLSKQNVCILMKLERDKGAQLTLNPKTHSFNIEEVQNLMLTEKTKIFKVALFLLRDEFELKYDGFIMDHQTDMRRKKDITTWFLGKFLGCKPFEDPKIATQKFYNYTRAYIATIEDKIEQAEYLMHLNSYVQKNTKKLSPKEFAEDYLKTTELKNNYKNYLKTKNFSFTSFQRDITQITGQVKKITVLFQNGITIIGDKGEFGNRVKLEKLKDGQHKAIIKSKIKKIE